jgi:hypothetical protein
MILRAVMLVFAMSLITGCKSPDPGNLFNTGKDARVYNPMTGRYEWPDDSNRH